MRVIAQGIRCKHMSQTRLITHLIRFLRGVNHHRTVSQNERKIDMSKPVIVTWNQNKKTTETNACSCHNHCIEYLHHQLAQINVFVSWSTCKQEPVTWPHCRIHFIRPSEKLWVFFFKNICTEQRCSNCKSAVQWRCVHVNYLGILCGWDPPSGFCSICDMIIIFSRSFATY